MSSKQVIDPGRLPDESENAPRVRTGREAAVDRQELLLDEALKTTFPASDPVSIVRIT